MDDNRPPLKEGNWQDVFDQLAFIMAALEELLRRTPEPRCAYCGQGSSMHSQKFGIDHEFIV